MRLITRFARLVAACALLPAFAYADEGKRFVIDPLSAEYSAEITGATCAADSCSGPATITLKRRNGSVMQTFKTEDMSVLLNAKGAPGVNTAVLYGDQSALIADDFNFDGSTDLAIRNGNNGQYGGPSYDVYVFNRSRGQFVPSEELTTLASENLGMFQVDAKRKRLRTFEKSGCCFHATTEYAVVPGKGLVVMRTLEEDATGDGDMVKVTTCDRRQGRMQCSTKRYPIKTYYKD